MDNVAMKSTTDNEPFTATERTQELQVEQAVSSITRHAVLSFKNGRGLFSLAPRRRFVPMGYIDDKNLQVPAGSPLRATISTPRLMLGKVFTAVFGAELGQVLRVLHDNKGNMKSIVDLNESLMLCITCAASKIRFSQRDARSLCQHRVLVNKMLPGPDTSGWMNCSRIRPSTEHELTNGDAKMATLVFENAIWYLFIRRDGGMFLARCPL